MRRILTAIAAFLFIGGPPAAMAGEWAVPDMNRTIDQTNFVVNDVCSGTLIDLKKRYVLTAHHCVDEQYETVEHEKIDDKGVVTKEKVRILKKGFVKQIAFSGANEVRTVKYITDLKAYDKDHDLALLRIVSDIPNTIAAPIACAAPVRGDRVYIVGNPTGILYSSVVSGIVSSVQRTYGSIKFPSDLPDAALTQISGGVIGGNSGGAAYNDRGELIGVPVLGNRTNEVIAFAVPLDVIRDFLKAQNVKNACVPD